MDSIYALSSGPGKAGVAVIRISGPASRQAVFSMAGALPPPRRASLRHLSHPLSAEVIDQAMVLWFPAPRSFTGEDVAEFHVHGGRAVIAAILQALSSIETARPAQPGEFTRRAFANGRLDLTEVEGLADLISADTDLQRRMAVKVALGENRRLYEGWRSELIAAQALIEASIDFSDEGDVPDETRLDVRQRAARLADAIERHLASFERASRLRDGVQVAIAGPPNAGKSSLINWLAQRDVAIVTPVPGTTRDVLEVHLNLGGVPFTVSDMAGLRDTGDAIEQEGIRRAKARLAAADLVIWLSEEEEPLPASGGTIWPVRSKADLAPESVDHRPAISVKTGLGLRDLLGRIERFGLDLVGEQSDEPTMIRERYRASFEAAVRHLQGVAANGASEAAEFMAEELRLAARHVGRVTGNIDVEDVLGDIFAQFCVGK